MVNCSSSPRRLRRLHVSSSHRLTSKTSALQPPASVLLFPEAADPPVYARDEYLCELWELLSTSPSSSSPSPRCSFERRGGGLPVDARNMISGSFWPTPPQSSSPSPRSN